MCGIAGFLGLTAVGGDGQKVLRAMTDALIHRGPDSAGYWIDQSAEIAFGHRRLAIIDLSAAGAQPMTSVSGAWVVIFNGEIYNHLELRSELEIAVGARFIWRGHSDTETLLACLDQWGLQGTIQRLVGMFAIAIWSVRDQQLILVRDRFGEKPLYYAWLSGSEPTLVFGSELKALEQHPAYVARINRNALSLYMQHMCVSGDLSIASGVNKVPPASMLVFKKNRPGEYHRFTYWQITDSTDTAESTRFLGEQRDDEAISTLDCLLRRSIRGQMLSDVPLGAFLSGGVDSSAIVAVMQQLAERPIKTFSIGFSESDFDEANYAKMVAASLGTDHTELYVSAESARHVIPELPSIYDEPFADSSQIPTVLVARLARKHVTVALSGDGGDEVFGGYNRYVVANQYWPFLKKVPLRIRKLMSAGLLSLSPSQLRQIAGLLYLNRRWAGIDSKLQKGARVMSADSLLELYQRLTTTWADPVVLDVAAPRMTADIGDGANDVSWMMRADLRTYLPSDILVKVDRAAMATSLETRVPFLDHRVVEWSMSLPLAMKLRKTDGVVTSKWVLRQLLYRYVPRALIDRPKMGFGIPLAEWLRGPLRSWADDLLNAQTIRHEGFFDDRLITRRWTEHRSGKRDWEHHIWCVLMFQSWLRASRYRSYS
jgi:asparagine synthase (glutamine-hydrolysing)